MVPQNHINPTLTCQVSHRPWENNSPLNVSIFLRKWGKLWNFKVMKRVRVKLTFIYCGDLETYCRWWILSEQTWVCSSLEPEVCLGRVEERSWKDLENVEVVSNTAWATEQLAELKSTTLIVSYHFHGRLLRGWQDRDQISQGNKIPSVHIKKDRINLPLSDEPK